MMFHVDCAYFSTIDEESPEEKEVRDTRQCSYLISQRKPLPQKKGRINVGLIISFLAGNHRGFQLQVLTTLGLSPAQKPLRPSLFQTSALMTCHDACHPSHRPHVGTPGQPNFLCNLPGGWQWLINQAPYQADCAILCQFWTIQH